jgi:hypothetical protein
LDLNEKDCKCKGIFADGNRETEIKCPEKIEIHELNCWVMMKDKKDGVNRGELYPETKKTIF